MDIWDRGSAFLEGITLESAAEAVRQGPTSLARNRLEVECVQEVFYLHIMCICTIEKDTSLAVVNSLLLCTGTSALQQ